MTKRSPASFGTSFRGTMKPNFVPIGTLLSLYVCAQLSAAVAASLTIQELPNGQVQVAWPSDIGSFNLEQADSLTAPVAWRAVSDPAVNAGGEFSVLIQPSTQTRFYRLRGGA